MEKPQKTKFDLPKVLPPPPTTLKDVDDSEDEPRSQSPSQDQDEDQIHTWPVDSASDENSHYYVGFSPIHDGDPEDLWEDVEQLFGDIPMQGLSQTEEVNVKTMESEGIRIQETEEGENSIALPAVANDTENVDNFGCTCVDCMEKSGHHLEAGNFQLSKRCIRPDRTQIYTPEGEILTVSQGILDNLEGKRLECIMRIVPTPFDGHIVFCRFFGNDTQFVRHSVFRIYFEQELLEYYASVFQFIPEEKKEKESKGDSFDATVLTSTKMAPASDGKLDEFHGPEKHHLVDINSCDYDKGDSVSELPQSDPILEEINSEISNEDKRTDNFYENDTEDNRSELDDDDTDFEVNQTEGKNSDEFDSSISEEEGTPEDSTESYSEELSSDSNEISSDSDSFNDSESDSEDDERIVDLSKL